MDIMFSYIKITKLLVMIILKITFEMCLPVKKKWFCGLSLHYVKGQLDNVQLKCKLLLLKVTYTVWLHAVGYYEV